jgi:hypothetical protein
VIVTLSGGPHDGRVASIEPGWSSVNIANQRAGTVDVYHGDSGVFMYSYPTFGGPFADYRPDRWDYEQITRPDRIRRNILANLPPGRPGRFQKASPAATGDTTPTNTP